ncbi:MAG: Acetyl-coenzyme A carboxyl transferase alpha chain, partial [uncultured Sphingomonas sp.]
EDLSGFREADRGAGDAGRRAARNGELGRDRHRRRNRAAGGQSGAAAQGNLRQADALAEGAGRTSPGSPTLQGLCGRADRRVHAASRRPRLCRRPGDCRRAGADRGAAGRADRAREGRRYGQPAAPQLRHGQARRLPQGDPADAAGRPLRAAGGEPGRYARRLPRRGSRGAGTGGGDRPIDRAVPSVARAAGRRGGRRGRLGRRGGDCCGEPGADVRARGLFGDLTRRLRVHPVAHRRPGSGSRGSDADHGGGPCDAWRGGPDHPGTGRRRAASPHGRDRVSQAGGCPGIGQSVRQEPGRNSAPQAGEVPGHRL